jgi:ATP-dependent exoDNAse (exonuclease V) beta subunit
LRLAHSPRVRLLTAMLRVVQDPAQPLARAQCLYYMQRCGLPVAGPFAEAAARFRDALPAPVAALLLTPPALPLYPLCEALAREAGFSNPCRYVQGFLDRVIEFGQTQTGGPGEFLAWWDGIREEASVVTGEGEDAVSILTIHRAKGLQFPVVIVPFTSWSLQPHRDAMLWVHSDEPPYAGAGRLPVRFVQRLADTFFSEDYRAEMRLTAVDNFNLLYVAFTRAEERLFFFAPDDAGKSGIKTIAHLVSRVFAGDDLGAEVIRRGEKPEPAPAEPLRVVEPKDRSEEPPGSMRRPVPVPLRRFVSSAWHTAPFSPPETPAAAGAAAYGTLVHRLLARIRVESDADFALSQEPALRRGDAGDRKAVEEAVAAVLALCRPLQWFTGAFTVLTEAELAMPGGGLARPDRVMTSGARAVVLDYKTGERDAHHAGQVKGYLQSLQAAGFEKPEGWLLYLQEMELVAVA